MIDDLKTAIRSDIENGIGGPYHATERFVATGSPKGDIDTSQILRFTEGGSPLAERNQLLGALRKKYGDELLEMAEFNLLPDPRLRTVHELLPNAKDAAQVASEQLRLARPAQLRRLREQIGGAESSRWKQWNRDVLNGKGDTIIDELDPAFEMPLEDLERGVDEALAKFVNSARKDADAALQVSRYQAAINATNKEAYIGTGAIKEQVIDRDGLRRFQEPITVRTKRGKEVKTATYRSPAEIERRIKELRDLPNRTYRDVAEQSRLTGALEKVKDTLPGQHPAELTGRLVENTGNFEAILTRNGGDALAAVRDRDFSKYAYRVMEAARKVDDSRVVLELRDLTKKIYKLRENAIQPYFGPGTAAEARLADEARALVAKLRETSDKAIVEALRREAAAGRRAGGR